MLFERNAKKVKLNQLAFLPKQDITERLFSNIQNSPWLDQLAY